MRVNAYLARAGISSRRGADELIKAGKVTINGDLAELNSKVGDKDLVKVSGKKIQAQSVRYILINKPAGVVTTLKDPEGRKKILDLLSITERVIPVGRLDYNTTGALLLTNDGELAQRLMHPSFKVSKVYIAEVEGIITFEKIAALEKGVRLEDGMTAPAHVQKIDEKTVELNVHEGRKHQVKRMLDAVGLRTKKLDRIRYAGIDLTELEKGQWRELTEAEIYRLKMVQ